jgi:hypothetical protein
MKDQEIRYGTRRDRIRASVMVCEFDERGAFVQRLHNSADLSAPRTIRSATASKTEGPSVFSLFLSIIDLAHMPGRQ